MTLSTSAVAVCCAVDPEISNDPLGIVGNVIRHNEYSKLYSETLSATSTSFLIHQSMTA
jgi:hypothetical protein